MLDDICDLCHMLSKSVWLLEVIFHSPNDDKCFFLTRKEIMYYVNIKNRYKDENFFP